MTVTPNDVAFSADEFAEDIRHALESDPAIAQALLQPGSKLKEHSLKIERELREVEVGSVRDYVRQSSRVADLHSQLQRCDGILAEMQERLLGFEADLGSASRDLKSLRSESRRMSTKLKNRQAAEASLGGVLKHVALDPRHASIICDGAVNDAFVEAVAALDAALNFACEKGADVEFSRDWRSCRDLAPLMEKLRGKATARCGDELLERIDELHRDSSNVHQLQRVRLARLAPLQRFLERHAPEVAHHVKDVYVDRMARTLHALFRAYHAELEKLDLPVADKCDMVAVHEDEVRYPLTGRVSLAKRGDGFSLGDRASVLKRLDAPPLLVHVAIKEKRRYPFEELFRSSLRHLADAALSEMHFVTAFLHGGENGPAVQSTLQAIFRRAFSATLEHLENKLFACHDAVGLLLVVRLIESARKQATRGPAPAASALDAFLGDCEALVRPRLLVILAQNIDGVKQSDLKRLGDPSTSPHYVARRYGELHATVLALFPDACRQAFARDPDALSPPASPQASPIRKLVDAARRSSGGSSRRSSTESVNDEPAAKQAALHVGELRERTAELLLRLARRLKQGKERHIFLVNNYDLITSIFAERDVSAHEADVVFWLNKLHAERDAFVEDALRAAFADLIDFVRAAERSADAQLDVGQAQALAASFNASWKGAIANANADVLRLFANFVNGVEVLKQVLTQLLLYYTRFQEIVRKGAGDVPFAADLVPTATILDEIKKYSRIF